MANKIIKVPVKDVDGLQSDGSYNIRYRIKSSDGSRKSEWSEVVNLAYPLNSQGLVSSFYEIYIPQDLNAYYGRPSLSNISGEDPHPSNGYQVDVVNVNTISPGAYINSSINYLQDDSNLYTYTWTMPSSVLVNKTFDVYLSWKYGTDWSDWEYSGTTTENTFSFLKPDSTAQYVQAAVFLSSSPKLTNIYGSKAETTFVSISPTFSTYSSSTTGTIGSITGSGPYRATITGLTDLPATNVISGRRVFATSGTGNFGTGAVTVVSTSSGTSMTVTSPNTLNAGTVTNVRI